MELNPELKKIIRSSAFEIIKGTFIYARVNQIPKDKHFMVATDGSEITVVTEESRLNELDVVERNKDNYSLIALIVSVPFYSVGFLATVSGAIAEAGMNILIVSTYSRDYIMVKKDVTQKIKNILLSLGFQEKA